MQTKNRVSGWSGWVCVIFIQKTSVRQTSVRQYAFVKIRCQMSTIQIVNNPSKISWSQIQSWIKYKKLITSNLGQASLVVKISWKSVNNFLSNPPKNTKQTIRQTVPVVELFWLMEIFLKKYYYLFWVFF